MKKTKYNSHVMDDIKSLDLDKDVLTILADNGINNVGDIWILNRKKLKGLGLKDIDINFIIVKLQLLGLDLNKKVYSVD